MTLESDTEAKVPGPRCWWCGAPADSREHKFKQAELRMNNGRGPWSGDDAVVHARHGEDLRQIHGPNASSVKFGPSLCKNCNNARSQIFDRAYDRFIEFMATNESVIGVDRRFRFSDIYGPDWPDERVNLIKYWVKHVCCMAVDNELTIPELLINYLDDTSAGAGAPPHIRFDMLVQSDLLRLRLYQSMEYGSFIGDVAGYATPDGRLVAIEGHTMWGWVMVTYRYDSTEPFGSTTFEGDLVQMGFTSLVSSEYTLDPTDLMNSQWMAHLRDTPNPTVTPARKTQSTRPGQGDALG